METVRRFFAIALAIVAFNQPSAAKAADLSEIPYIVLSNGQVTCGEFLSDNPGSQKTDMEWILGYISGRNREAFQGTRMAGRSFTQPESVLAWLQNYCRIHALDPLVNAGDSLRTEFLRREGPQ
jgi:hypothetical protein